MSIDDTEYDDGITPSGRKPRTPPPLPERTTPELGDCPLRPLGKTAGLFVFMTPGGEIEYVRAKDLSSRTVLAGLFDGDTSFLRTRFPDRRSPVQFGAEWAAEWLMAACVAQGFFHAERQLRGPGAWRLQRGQGLLLHHGDAIEVRSEHGSPVLLEAGTRHGDYIYVASRAEAKPAKQAATREDVAGLFNFLDRWRYGHGEDPRVILGWLGCAYLAGALRWRPHIWLTGGTATGKSTLEGVIRDLLGSSALRASEPTKMAIAQLLAGAARPVLLDEFERDIDPQKQDAVVQLARLASTEDQAGMIRGSPEGRVRTYMIRACFYLSGIVPAPLQPQDRARIHVIDLRELDDPAAGDVAEVMSIAATMPALGPRLRARAIDGFWRFQENERIFEAAILKVWKKGGRVVDQMGTLLSMSEMLLRDTAIGLDEACDLLRRFDEVRDDILGRADEGESQNCLSHLMTSAVRCEHVEKTVGEIVCNVRENSGGDERLIPSTGDHRFLMRHGMRVLRIDGQGLGLAVARKHRGLSALFEGTHWSGGAWNAVLKRVAGSYVPTQPVRFSGEIERCRVFPIELLPISPVTAGTDGRDDCVEAPPATASTVTD